jgi:adenylylsulfate kinase-like enzyme
VFNEIYACFNFKRKSARIANSAQIYVENCRIQTETTISAVKEHRNEYNSKIQNEVILIIRIFWFGVIRE